VAELVVDTSVRGAGLVLLSERGTVLGLREVAGGAGSLQESLRALLAAVAAPVSSVLVARGPGSYIGVRSGLAAGLGFAQGSDRPIHLVGSLRVVAETVDPEEARVLVLRGAGRGGTLCQLFAASELGWTAEGPSQLLSRDQTIPRSWLDGSGIIDPDGVMPAGVDRRRLLPVRGLDLALARLAAAAQGPGVPYDQVSADYAVRVGAER
jgi:tRNA A37 threonylcarbamoyladenosine modification protein TsaB